MTMSVQTNPRATTKRLAGFFVLSLALVFPARLGYAETPQPRRMTYASFVEAVGARHPERSIDEKTVARAKENERRSGLLPDPEMKVGRDEVPLRGRLQREPEMAEMAKGDAEWRLELSQSFPWPGTLSAEERAAKARVASVESDAGLAATIRQLEAKELYLRLVRTAKLIEVERGNFAVVDGIREFTNEKFKQGVGSHNEFLQAHSESGVLRGNIAALEADLKNLKRHALLLMDDPAALAPDSVSFDLEWPGDLVGNVRDKTPAEVNDLAREKIVRGKEADLARQDAEYRRSLPSFMASGMLMQEDSGMRMYGAMVGVTVPVYSNIKRRSLSAEDSLVESRSGAEVAWHDRRKALALAQAESRLTQIEANRRSLENEIIPPVREHIEAATVQFSQGKSGIGSIIDGRRTLLNLQVTEIRMTEALALAHLMIEKIKAGLVDEAIDLEVPQLTGAAGGSMRMEEGGMGNMTTTRRGMPMKGGKAAKKPDGMDMRPSEEEPSQGSSPGMGM